VGIEEPCKHDTLHKTTILENYLIVQFSPYFCWGKFSMQVPETMQWNYTLPHHVKKRVLAQYI